LYELLLSLSKNILWLVLILLYRKKIKLIGEICKPFGAYFDIDLFTRVTFMLDANGNCIGIHGLASHAGLFEEYTKKLSDNGKCFTQAIKETGSDSYAYFIWQDSFNCPQVDLLRQKFNIQKGIAIYKRLEDRIDGWSFSSQNPDVIASAITSSIISLFHDFITYFEEKRIQSKLHGPFIHYPTSFDMAYINPNPGHIDKFKDLMGAQKRCLSINNQSIPLAKREYDCIQILSQGKTYKEIAEDLSLSPRTFETYMNQIKQKTGNLSKSKLINYFMKNLKANFL
jgi:DNA-binding CsgD family transcriptional regulator